MKWVSTYQEATTWLTNDEIPGIQLAIRLEDDDTWSLSWAVTFRSVPDGEITLPIVESWVQAIAVAIDERLVGSDSKFRE